MENVSQLLLNILAVCSIWRAAAAAACCSCCGLLLLVGPACCHCGKCCCCGLLLLVGPACCHCGKCCCCGLLLLLQLPVGIVHVTPVAGHLMPFDSEEVAKACRPRPRPRDEEVSSGRARLACGWQHLNVWELWQTQLEERCLSKMAVAGWLTGWLAGWLPARLAAWLLGWLAG
jgi:hypothetical protein